MAKRINSRNGEPQELGVLGEIPDRLWERMEPLGVLFPQRFAEIPDSLWERIEPILRQSWPRKPTGRPTADWPKVLGGILFRMRTPLHMEQAAKAIGRR